MVLSLDGRGPRYGQITRAMVALIQRGALAPGSRAPSTRDLADSVGCSRNVALLAYEQLLMEGYFVSRPRAGTFVSAELPRAEAAPGGHPHADVRPPHPASMRPAREGRRLLRAATRAMQPVRHLPLCTIDFIYGLTQPDARLVRQFRRAVARPLDERAFSYGPPAGDVDLRREIAARLRTTRGLSCAATDIVMTSGTQQALDLAARLLVSPGDRVIVERPGYAAAAAAFRAAGGVIVGGRVDAQGLNPAALPRVRPAARVAYVTPSHQFPTGAVMPAARRYALIAWARRTGAVIFEDDYDGEFRYAGRPIPALASLAPDAVIYCGTLAKSLFPACRVGYVVVPAPLAEAFARAKWMSDLGNSRLIERALAWLFATREYDRHIRRAERRYRGRRDALVGALERRFGRDVVIDGSSAGLHLVAHLRGVPPGRLADVIAGCRARGVGVYPLARDNGRSRAQATLLMGYGLVDEEQIERGVQVLAEVCRALTRPRASV
jgi:GntR family transcriptional regulator/MocR family aminotransferase